MPSHLITSLTRTLLALGLSLTIPLPTFAGVIVSTIDPVAHLAERGRALTVTGPILCTIGERLAL